MMNPTFLLSPLVLSLGVMTGLFMGALYLLDRRRTSHQKHLHGLMRSFVRANAMQSFSVIIRTDTAAGPIAPLIDRLYEQGYPKLQVVLLVGALADKERLNGLRRMQRQKRGSVRLRIIRSEAGGDERALIRRYADGDALLWLDPQARLTVGFFSRMSIELLDESVDAITPRLALSVDDTLKSADRALSLVAAQTVATVFDRRSSGPHVIRRASYLAATPYHSINVEHSTMTVSEVPVRIAGAFIGTILLASVLSVAAAAAVVLPYGWQIVTSAFVAMIVLLMIVRLLTYPYSAWTKLALAVMVPLWPIVAVTFTGAGAARHLWGTLRKQRVRPVRQP